MWSSEEVSQFMLYTIYHVATNLCMNTWHMPIDRFNISWMFWAFMPTVLCTYICRYSWNEVKLTKVPIPSPESEFILWDGEHDRSGRGPSKGTKDPCLRRTDRHQPHARPEVSADLDPFYFIEPHPSTSSLSHHAHVRIYLLHLLPAPNLIRNKKEDSRF